MGTGRHPSAPDDTAVGLAVAGGLGDLPVSGAAVNAADGVEATDAAGIEQPVNRIADAPISAASCRIGPFRFTRSGWRCSDAGMTRVLRAEQALAICQVTGFGILLVARAAAEQVGACSPGNRPSGLAS